MCVCFIVIQGAILIHIEAIDHSLKKSIKLPFSIRFVLINVSQARQAPIIKGDRFHGKLHVGNC